MSLNKFKKFQTAVLNIRKGIENRHVSHAYIIEGDKNVDKIGFAIEFIKAILCREEPGNGCDRCSTCKKLDAGNYEDLILIEPEKGNELKKSEIEKVRNFLLRKAISEEGRNIAIISDADKMNRFSQNSLLKTLEEPRPGAILILLSENSGSLLPTIRSRCVKYRLMSDEGLETNNGVASDFMNLIDRGLPFYRLINAVDEICQKRNEAADFLDALQTYMRNRLRHEIEANKGERINFYVANIELIEDIKGKLVYNVNYKYALREMILRIEGNAEV